MRDFYLVPTLSSVATLSMRKISAHIADQTLKLNATMKLDTHETEFKLDCTLRLDSKFSPR